MEWPSERKERPVEHAGLLRLGEEGATTAASSWAASWRAASIPSSTSTLPDPVSAGLSHLAAQNPALKGLTRQIWSSGHEVGVECPLHFRKWEILPGTSHFGRDYQPICTETVALCRVYCSVPRPHQNHSSICCQTPGLEAMRPIALCC